MTACGSPSAVTACVSSTDSAAPIISSFERSTAQQVRIPVAGCCVFLKGDASSCGNVSWYFFFRDVTSMLSSALPFYDETACGSPPLATAHVSVPDSTAPITSAFGRHTAQRVRIPAAGFVFLKRDARLHGNVAGYSFVWDAKTFLEGARNTTMQCCQELFSLLF